MKVGFWLGRVAAALVVSSVALAQAPAGSTGQCKDGTYTTAAKKSGACSGHKGVGTWYAAAGNSSAASTPAAGTPAAGTPATNMPASAMQSAPTAVTPAHPAAPSPASGQPGAQIQASPAASRPQAAGGGPGMVWVNTSSKVYHCLATAYYGKTKSGKYVSEADAKAEGNRADHGKACSQ